MKQAMTEGTKVDADARSTKDTMKLNLSPYNDDSSEKSMSSWGFSS